MKKFSIRTSRLLAGAAVAAALFAACTADTEDEPVAAVPLRFAVSMPESWNTPDAARSTADKALPTRAESIADIESFGVFAYVEGNKSPYMDNVKVTAMGDGSCTFGDGKSYYLPNGKSVTFYAYSPYGTLTYSVTNTTETGENLLIAGKAVSVTSDFTGEIALTFSHALSKVTFTVDDQTTNKAYTDNPTFTLDKVVTSGTLKPNVGTTSDPFWIWGDTTSTEFSKKDVDVYYYMIPYDFTNENMHPNITFYGTVGTDVFTAGPTDITNASKGDRIEKWEKNKTYTYEFQISDGSSQKQSS